MFVLWGEMTSAFKGQPGPGERLHKGFLCCRRLPAPGVQSPGRAGETTGRVLSPKRTPRERARQICLKQLLGLHEEKGWLDAAKREASTPAPKHTATLPVLFAISPHALSESRGDTEAEQT